MYSLLKSLATGAVKAFGSNVEPICFNHKRELVKNKTNHSLGRPSMNELLWMTQGSPEAILFMKF